MFVDIGWWSFNPTILAWKNGPRRPYVTISLAEQIRRTHSVGPSLEEQEAREADEKADERARLELFDKRLKEWDARHQSPEGD